MENITFDTLVYDRKARDKFFYEYDRLIGWCKEYGYLDAALDHKRNRKRIWDEVTLLD
ncbi:hypothetical protein [uncultured Agrobacterium sp.]|uniref:hypothetical protein n=1 Tax=uncultured Agrobacterium sp. TaxID=157277 RepID=UPI0025ECAC1C|nr:hypothetical protein [uncultured Agrobacterium sp.]